MDERTHHPRRTRALSKLLGAAAASGAVAVLAGVAPAAADAVYAISTPAFAGTTPGGTVTSCIASASARTFVDPLAAPPAAYTFSANTTCDREIMMTGTVSVIPNGGSTPAETASFPSAYTKTESAQDGSQDTSAGAVYMLRYTTTLTATTTPRFSWTQVPPQCTASGKSITCTVQTPFTVS